MKRPYKLAIVSLLLLLFLHGYAGGDIPDGMQKKSPESQANKTPVATQNVKPQPETQAIAPKKQATASPPVISKPEAKPEVTAAASETISLGELYSQYPETVFRKGDSNSKKIALTFDDGPNDVTCNQVLDVLKEKKVKGTFFLLGSSVAKYPDVVRRIVDEGHVIGSHSWSHPRLSKATLERMQKEVLYSEDAISKITGLKPNLFRPPYGELNRTNLEYLKQGGYKVVTWSSDSMDWKYPKDLAKVRHNTLKDARGGAIILFHTPSSKEQSQVIAKLLPEIIDTLKAKGFQFVTVDDLLGVPAYR
jgi:peptidoglycan/xylan/chitin deacetylase (PgdA/CDA1 family)